MMERLRYTWALMGESWEMLKKDKELLLFPVLSGVCCLLVLASFGIPMWQGEFWAPPGKDSPASEQVTYYLMLFLFYCCNYFVITFFNSAIVACAVLRMQGRDPTVGDGLRAALARLPQILGWALVAATVGIILRIIEDRSRTVGQILAGLLGFVWTAASFLVVPIMVMDRKGPIVALRESSGLLRRTWGEQIFSGFSFGLIFIVLALPAFLVVFLLGGIAMATGGIVLLAVCVGVAVLYLVVLALVISVLQTIFQAALYMYVREGKPSPDFSADLLAGAMGPR